MGNLTQESLLNKQVSDLSYYRIRSQIDNTNIRTASSYSLKYPRLRLAPLGSPSSRLDSLTMSGCNPRLADGDSLQN